MSHDDVGQEASYEESKASEQKREHKERQSTKEAAKETKTSKKSKIPIEEILAQKDTIKIPSKEETNEVRKETSEEKKVYSKTERLEEERSFIYSQDVAKLKESGNFDKLLKGEKITIYSPDKAISTDLAIVDSGELYIAMPGNLQIYDMDKLSERQKELVESASKLQLIPYMNEKVKRE